MTATTETTMKENIEIRPADGQCENKFGSLRCNRAGTVKINGHNHCDYHAEQVMIAACGRLETKIVRTKSA